MWVTIKAGPFSRVRRTKGYSLCKVLKRKVGCCPCTRLGWKRWGAGVWQHKWWGGGVGGYSSLIPILEFLYEEQCRTLSGCNQSIAASRHSMSACSFVFRKMSKREWTLLCCDL
ncbi:hypothetical protein MLD38_020061 [Melastoma candidum]|uniref:Uncharacterized protein n=1 Tax=Melastoma candidum TaxID=119954 RepID=A0ACB9QBD7_9MYRT|nr:hypothetical protein MLD38_020061 [Melastoma candidum]